MKMKSFIFLFALMFVFTVPTFSVLNTNSDSGSMSTPSVKFKEWQVSRSDKGTDSTNEEHISFITNTETTCWFIASVGYDGNQLENTAPINPDTVSWEVVEASHDLTINANSLEKNWSQQHPSRLSTTTLFNVTAKLNVPEHTSTSSCPGDAGNRTPKHRNGDPMKFKIKFTAKTTSNHSVEKILSLTQDEVNQIRQEYVDLARKTNWTTQKGKKVYDGKVIRVPSRNEFSAANKYDDSHYTKMVNKDLEGKHSVWIQACKDYAKRQFRNEDVPNLTETGGYRNPHHHHYHVSGGSNSPRSWHQFGVALDVRGRNIDMNDDGQVGTLADRKAMADAIMDSTVANPKANYTIYTYTDKHVHAQWTIGQSNKRGFSVK